MNVYTQPEIEKIEKLKDGNDKLETLFQDKRTEWNKTVDPLFETLKVQMNSFSMAKITECQALCLSYRQMLNDQISTFLNKRSKQDVKLKKLRQDKFLWYATNFGVKTNMGEKTLLIEAHVAEEQRNIEVIEIYIEFLRQTNKNLESLQFSIKSMIELMNYLGK